MASQPATLEHRQPAPPMSVARMDNPTDYLENSEGGNTHFFLNGQPHSLLIGGEQVDFPAGCEKLEMQRRKCGDYYGEVKGKTFYVSGTGNTAAFAVQNALRQVRS